MPILSSSPTAPSTVPVGDANNGARLVTVDGRSLPLIGAALKADARGGLIRVTLEQQFRNPWNEPLRVTYALPLPAEAAVSGFNFQVGDQLVVGEVDTKKQARQRFEDAVLEGRTAALLDQERANLFTQQVGNVPPRTEVRCEVQLDQKLAWLPDGCWEWRFPTVVAPRYLGAPTRVADAANVTVDVADQALPVRLHLSMQVRDSLADGGRPESTTHALHTERSVGHTQVTFADERGVALDRDVVVRWKVAGHLPGLTLDTSAWKSRLFGLMTLVPPSPDHRMAKTPRDLIVLLDTSGSMGGEPLDQARRVTSALIDSLDDTDQLELIEFSSSPRRWRRGATPATAEHRRDAQAWLSRLVASGGTEMRSGILEALAPLRDEAQRQVVLITDGLIGFEGEIVDVVANQLPRGCRVHTIGIGSGVNRGLTQPVARAGRGLELIVGIGEDAEMASRRLLARTSEPLITNVQVSGSALRATAPARLPDLYGSAPALISVELEPTGGSLTVTGDTALGRYVEELRVPSSTSHAPAIPTLFAREQVEDLELSRAARRASPQVDELIERLGLQFQISTRLTSWVAISPRTTVDPRAPHRQEVVPQQLPYGMSAEGLGLRRSSPAPRSPPPAMHRPTPLEPAKERSQASAPPAMRAQMPEPAPDFEPSADELSDEDSFARQEVTSTPLEDRPAPRGTPSKPGLFERARRLLTGSGANEKKASPQRASAPSATAPSPKKDEGVARRVLKARLVRQANGELTLQFTVTDRALEWLLPDTALLVSPAGELTRVPVVSAKSTAAGTWGPGLAITLVLSCSQPLTSGTRVTLGEDDAALVLDVE